MNRHLTEKNDYILLPEIPAERLYEIYKGGPQFGRGVIQVGAYPNQQCIVRLFPPRALFYHVSDAEVDITALKPKELYLKSTRILGDVSYTSVYALGLGNWAEVRLWLKMTDAEIAEDAAAMAVPPSPSSSVTITGNDAREVSGPSTPRSAPPARKWTLDRTMTFGEWRLVSTSSNDVDLDTLMASSGRDCLEFLVEEGTRDYDYTNRQNVYEWPLQRQLGVWRSKLVVGDLVDGLCVAERAWFESVVRHVELNESGGRTITLYFRGLGTTEQVVLPEFAAYIQPLYTKTDNWREKIDEDDSVELKITDSATGKITCQ
jgi:hypothetical protein